MGAHTTATVAAGQGDCGKSKEGTFALPSLEQIAADLSNKEVSIVVKMNHLFALKEWGGSEAVRLLLHALKDKDTVDSVLFRHEAAFVLGQLGNPTAISFLEKTLADSTEDEMVRHEAAEALGALGSERSLKLLSAYVNDSSAPVRETCELAICSLHHRNTDPGADRLSKFNTVDPSEPYKGCNAGDVPRLFNILMDPKQRLWIRYRALVTLRDISRPASTIAVARALRYDESSALLRHEIAYFLGQIRFPPAVQDECTVASSVDLPFAEAAKCGPIPLAPTADEAALESAQALTECLENPDEHPMARHEAALGLGSLGSDEHAATSDASGKTLRDVIVNTLQTFLTCTNKVVAESCAVALSNMEEELSTRCEV